MLLNTLFTPEEKRLVLEKSKEENERQNVKDDPNRFMPKMDPSWDLNTTTGRIMVKQYQQLILYGIHHGVPRQNNISKLYGVQQGIDEKPTAFYERLCEIARKWTDLNPEEESSKMMFNMPFIRQAALDI